MPFIDVVYSSTNEISDDTLAAAISSVITSVLGKPIDYISVNINKSSRLYFAGTTEPSAMIQVIW